MDTNNDTLNCFVELAEAIIMVSDAYVTHMYLS